MGPWHGVRSDQVVSKRGVSMSNPTVVVVSKSLLLRKFLEINLALDGCVVKGAATLQEGAVLVAKGSPSAVIVDLQQESELALALVRSIRRAPGQKDAIIIATGESQALSSERLALSAGCDGYVADPYRTRRMRSLLRAYLPAVKPRARRRRTNVGTRAA